jgi:adenosyl cobinamide kinase/adenosyl cobinamide phosphate guanylyltransferase
MRPTSDERMAKRIAAHREEQLQLDFNAEAEAESIETRLARVEKAVVLISDYIALKNQE